jgi:phosphoketolase
MQTAVNCRRDEREMEMLSERGHGLSESDFEIVFIADESIISNFHGYR